MDLWQGYRAQLQSARSSALLLQLVDNLFSNPAITVAQAAKKLGVTHRSAKLNIDKLVHKNILKEATGRKRNWIFVAPEIINIIDAQKA